MLRGTPDHPKFVALQAALGLPRAHVVGLLELLWHFTAAYAPAGDVGRWPDAAIEGGCGWEGEPGALIVALIASRWIDADIEHRLVIHDWAEHTDRHVKRRLSRRGMAPVGRPAGTHRAPGGHPAGTQSAAPPVPVPVPVPVPEPVPVVHGAQRAPGNPLIAGRRQDLERECLDLVREMAEFTGEDPLDVIARASGYEGAARTKLNPSTMSDDRLANTVRDLRADVAEERAKARDRPALRSVTREVPRGA